MRRQCQHRLKSCERRVLSQHRARLEHRLLARSEFELPFERNVQRRGNEATAILDGDSGRQLLRKNGLPFARSTAQSISVARCAARLAGRPLVRTSRDPPGLDRGTLNRSAHCLAWLDTCGRTAGSEREQSAQTWPGHPHRIQQDLERRPVQRVSVVERQDARLPPTSTASNRSSTEHAEERIETWTPSYPQELKSPCGRHAQVQPIGRTIPADTRRRLGATEPGKEIKQSDKWAMSRRSRSNGTR